MFNLRAIVAVVVYIVDIPLLFAFLVLVVKKRIGNELSTLYFGSIIDQYKQGTYIDAIVPSN